MGNKKMKIVIFTMLAAISTIIASSLRRNENKSKSDISKLQHTCKIECRQEANKKSWDGGAISSSSDKGDLFIRQETKVYAFAVMRKGKKLNVLLIIIRTNQDLKNQKRFLIYNGGFTKSGRSKEKIQSWIFDGT